MCGIPPPQRADGLDGTEQVDRLQAALNSLVSPTDCVIVAGDLNAHIGQLPDIPDYEALEMLGAAVPLGLHAGMGRAAYQGIQLQRANSSTVAPTEKGKRLLSQLCIGGGLVVANGRAPGDADGTCTYPTPQVTQGFRPSMIDLLLLAPPLMRTLACVRSSCIPATFVFRCLYVACA
jgi:hypothetical protein